MTRRHVFVTGGTGYLGRPLIAQLVARGHHVKALVRPGSEPKLPQDAAPVLGDALSAATFGQSVAPADTLVHLVGVPRPSPAKAQAFRAVDLSSIKASVTAARQAGVSHLVYVSVAHPAPIMHAYITVRREGEDLVRASGLKATILRPWYVLGPGHWWPYALIPFYAVCERLPWTRAGARRLGLVTLAQMVAALVRAVEQPANELQIVEVPEIRAAH